jgi:hypothetical protein
MKTKDRCGKLGAEGRKALELTGSTSDKEPFIAEVDA